VGGGISIGASHNTADWNALKFFGPEGIYLSTAEAGELLDIYHLRKFDLADWQRIGQIRRQPDSIERYVDELAGVYDLDLLRQFQIVVDCCNGTSSLILRVLQECYGMNFVLINEQIDGAGFAHDPATNREMVGLQLAPLVKPLGADAGFLFDADSDRVAIATEDGTAVSEELILPMVADFLLPRRPGRLVITNLSSTALLDLVTARHGGKVLRVPVGRQAAIDALSSYRPEQVAVAGEGTGAVMMPQFRFVYDGIASMLAILTMMAERGQTLSEIVSSYPKYSMLKADFPLVSARVPLMLTELRERYSDGQANAADGLRVDWDEEWFHVRVSQTEPLIRVIAERRGGPPSELFEDLVSRVRRLA
jgi:phosphomannomutase